MSTEQGPGAAYDVFAMSEDLVDQLKLLDYEKELVAKVDGFRIIPRWANLCVCFVFRCGISWRMNCGHNYCQVYINNYVPGVKTLVNLLECPKNQKLKNFRAFSQSSPKFSDKKPELC